MARYNPSEINSGPVAEGVRVEIGDATAIAVRQENGDIALRIRRERRRMRSATARIPFLSGMARLVCTVADLLGGIAESSELEPQRTPKGNRFEQRFAELFQVHPASMVAFFSGLAMLVLLVGLVLAAPLALERLVLPRYGLSRPAQNAAVCAARVLGALIAAGLIPRLRGFRRLSMYQGAVNKAVNAYAAGNRVTRESAAAASPIARKSDGAFLVTVALISIVVFALVRIYTLPVQLLVRVMIVLAVAGVVNEPIRLLEALPRRHPAAWLLAPQLWIERLLVVRPRSQMVEVAVCAFNAAQENDR